MTRSAAAVVMVAGLALPAAAQPIVHYRVETHAVNTFVPDTANGTEVLFYDGSTDFDLGAEETAIFPGQSLVLRVHMHMPGHNQTFAGSGSRLLKSFGSATFDLTITGSLTGQTFGGSAPLNPTLYPLGVTSDWEDMVENFDPGTPNEAVFGVNSVTSIVPAQVPGFSSPLNTEATPWVVDLIWTPTGDIPPIGAYTWTLSAGRDVFVWAGNLNNGSDWVEFEAALEPVSGHFAWPTPSTGMLLLLAGAGAGRRRR